MRKIILIGAFVFFGLISKSQNTENIAFDNFVNFCDKYSIPLNFENYFMVTNFGCKGCNELTLNHLRTLFCENPNLLSKSIFIVESSVIDLFQYPVNSNILYLNLNLDESGLDPVNILYLRMNSLNTSFEIEEVLYKQGYEEIKFLIE